MEVAVVVVVAVVAAAGDTGEEAMIMGMGVEEEEATVGEAEGP